MLLNSCICFLVPKQLKVTSFIFFFPGKDQVARKFSIVLLIKIMAIASSPTGRNYCQSSFSLLPFTFFKNVNIKAFLIIFMEPKPKSGFHVHLGWTYDRKAIGRGKVHSGKFLPWFWLLCKNLWRGYCVGHLQRELQKGILECGPYVCVSFAVLIQ